uniref:pyridoxal phosphate-dependent decarboxylase family protein n=1 Tax=Pseudactinotalea sp. TaxID=1926260 RepID=UPI003B3B6F3E
VLSYVYDSGRADLDALAQEAAALFLPVNGLDPTTFTSVAVLERDLVAFTRDALHGGSEVVGSVTSGGTESCLLAVKSARDRLTSTGSGSGRSLLLMPTTAHPAFRKAVAYLDMGIVEVPVESSGAVDPDRFLATLDEHADVALAVVSAPSYPTGALDPVTDIAAGCDARGVDLHVDACIGGMVLPWWPDPLPPWDFSVPGVTSMSADLHKYGFAPKGASVVLYRGRERHRAQYFATASWPGYPVVNPTVLGSRSATALAAAWAVTQALGVGGYAELVGRTAEAARQLATRLERVDGLAITGSPAGPLLAVTAAGEGGVDPFLLVDEVRARGFLLQAQPAYAQPDGTLLLRSAHATLTPVSLQVVDALGDAIAEAADVVRGIEPPTPDPALVARVAANGLPERLAGVMATLEAMPRDQAPAVLTHLLASVIDPDR